MGNEASSVTREERTDFWGNPYTEVTESHGLFTKPTTWQIYKKEQRTLFGTEYVESKIYKNGSWTPEVTRTADFWGNPYTEVTESHGLFTKPTTWQIYEEAGRTLFGTEYVESKIYKNGSWTPEVTKKDWVTCGLVEETRELDGRATITARTKKKSTFWGDDYYETKVYKKDPWNPAKFANPLHDLFAGTKAREGDDEDHTSEDEVETSVAASFTSGFPAAAWVGNTSRATPLSFDEIAGCAYSKSQTFGQKLARAGLRRGEFGTADACRAEALYEKIPTSVRRSEGRVQAYLKSRDASHIISHHNGGSGSPDNIEWEDKYLNRARGKANMFDDERSAVMRANDSVDEGFWLSDIRGAALRGSAAGSASAAMFSALEDGKEYSRGHIDGEEYAWRVGAKTITGAGHGAVGGVCAMLAAEVAPSAAALVLPAAGAAATAAASYRLAYGVDQFFAKESYSPGIFESHVRHDGWFTSETERRGWFSTTVEKRGLFGTTVEKK